MNNSTSNFTQEDDDAGKKEKIKFMLYYLLYILEFLKKHANIFFKTINGAYGSKTTTSTPKI